MGNITQDGRQLQINTPLGKDVLLINRFSASEGLSQLFSLDVELLHREDDEGYETMEVKPEEILGKTVSITVSQKDGGARYFTGIVNSFSQGNRNANFSYYYARVVPHIWILTQNRQSRIFQHISVPDILRKVFEAFDVSYEIQGDFKPRNYCAQYGESDFDFASRLMEEEGIYYYFEHDGNMDRMIVANTPQSHRDCPNKSELPYVVEKLTDDVWVSAIKSWRTEFTLQSGKITNWDYNFQLPTQKLDGEQPSQFNVGDNQKMEIYDFPGGYGRKYDGIDKTGGEQPGNLNNISTDKQNTVKVQMQALDARVKISKGFSDCCTLTAGHRFKLSNHPAKSTNGQYVITTVQHEAEQTPDYFSGESSAIPYETTFSCIPQGAGAPVFRPLATTPKPVVHGTQTAVVVGPAGEEIFTDKYGRVKVNFHWDREMKFDPDSSCWVRVARDTAGNKWGAMHIPRIGQEVIVAFENGDPDKPIVVGSVYNPNTMPHYELPKFKTLTYFKTRTSPDDGKGFNELRFEDKAGKEQVFLRSQKRMDVRVLQSLYETCGGNRQEVIGMRQDNKPGGNLAISVGGNYDLHVKGDWYVGIDGKLNEGVTGDVVEGYDGNQQTVVKSKVEINAQKITLEGSQSVTLKVGSSCVIVDMMGITIQGPMVKINSGGSAPPTGPAILDAPLDAETADTGEPGYLDRPRRGGGGGRKRRVLNGQHAPAVSRNNDGSYQVGKNIRVEGTDEFIGKTLNNLSTLNNTPTGNSILTALDNGTHQTTIKELDMARAQQNGALATRVDQNGSVTPGVGSDTIVEYNPDLVDNSYVDENGNNVTVPIESTLGHELIHAVHNDKGENKRNNPEPAEPDSNEEESQTIGIHGHKDDPMTENNLLKDLNQPFRRTDHDSSVQTVP